MTVKKWHAYDFRDSKKLRSKLLKSPLYVPTHKKIEFDETFANWQEFQDAKWIYKGFVDRVIKWFNKDEYFHPWVIELNSKSEVHLSGYIDGPNFGADFTLFYNSVEIGSFQIDPVWDSLTKNRKQEKEIWYYASLLYPRSIPYDSIQRLHAFMNLHSKNLLEQKTIFLSQMIDVVWNEGDPVEEITISGHGTYSLEWLQSQDLL